MQFALYGMPELEELGHAGCSIAVFCRNPLHPGPCKGFKRTSKVITDVVKKTGPRDGDGDGKLNEIYVPKGRLPGKGEPPKPPTPPAGGKAGPPEPPARAARLRPIAAGHRSVLDTLHGKEGEGSFLATHQKRDVNALVKKGHIERKDGEQKYHITEAGKAAREADDQRAVKKPRASGGNVDSTRTKTGGDEEVTGTAEAFSGRSQGKDLIAEDMAGIGRQVYANRNKIPAADGALAAIGARQGFDAKPRVVTKAEMDRLIADGATETHRGVRAKQNDYVRRADGSGYDEVQGVSAADIQEEMRSGHAYYGLGIFGNGYYWGDKDIATKYSDGSTNSVARAAIAPDAKKILYNEELTPKFSEFLGSLKGHPQEAALREAYGDPGRYAAALGYDVIQVNSPYGNPIYNVLNRSALAVEEASK